MTPLQSELHRLYGTPSPGSAAPEDGVRAMVIELPSPPGWRLLGSVWQGVQELLELPAPAIAVSGTDGLQLWFSLAAPVAPAQALEFLEGLRRRFLPDTPASRVRLTSGPAAPVPALQPNTGNWSAFVASDLAPVFEDTPWLDVAPNEEGQAALLRGLKAIRPAAFTAALGLLAPRANAPCSAPMATGGETTPGPASQDVEQEPRRFLLRVMNDESVALALRIEAAKALLTGS